jgi:hypothetical protein
VRTSSVLLLLSFCLVHSGDAACASAGSGQSLEIGVSYLHLRKSFLDFPMVWTSTLAVVSARYEVTAGKFLHRISFDYGRSTYININGSRRSGHNSFSVFGFTYDFIWRKLPVGGIQRLGWGLGFSLENQQISQRSEMNPGQYNQQKDHYFGVGPVGELIWKLGPGRLRFQLSPLMSIPRVSFGILRSDAGFTERSYLWWFGLKTGARYASTILANCELSVGLNREAFVYGRTWRTTPQMDMFYSGGSIILSSVEVSLNYHF